MINIANPLASMMPAFPLSNRAGGSAAPVPGAAAEPGSTARRTAGGEAVGKEPDSAKSRGAGEAGESAPRGDANAQGLEPAELKQLSELKARDREVRAHEAAHQAAGGQYAGAISYAYERGPDGAQYAVGGEVSIDTSGVDGDPQATIEKMRTVRAAALAPAEPSSQDRAVAAQAMQLMLQAQSELAVDSGSQDDQASGADVRVDSAPESEENGRGPRQNQDAFQAYQSVFRLGDAAPAQRSTEPFQATA